MDADKVNAETEYNHNRERSSNLELLITICIIFLNLLMNEK